MACRRNSHGPHNDPAPRPRADGNFFLRGCLRVGAVRTFGPIITSFLKQHAASVENMHRRRAAGLARAACSGEAVPVRRSLNLLAHHICTPTQDRGGNSYATHSILHPPRQPSIVEAPLQRWIIATSSMAGRRGPTCTADIRPWHSAFPHLTACVDEHSACSDRVCICWQAADERSRGRAATAVCGRRRNGSLVDTGHECQQVAASSRLPVQQHHWSMGGQDASGWRGG